VKVIRTSLWLRDLASFTLLETQLEPHTTSSKFQSGFMTTGTY
jgi:hypothetical protein